MIVRNEIKGLSFWPFLLENERNAFLNGTTVKKYHKNNYIYGLNDSCLGMVYVCKGSIRVFITSLEGREITLFHISKGECCIMSASCAIANITLDVEFVAEEDTEIISINSGTIKKLIDTNVNFRCFVYETTTKKLSIVVGVLQDIIFEKFDKRLAKFLLSLYEKTKKNAIQMTQETIAIEINSAREVVARTLKKFAYSNLIELKRGVIIIKNEEQLRKISE